MSGYTEINQPPVNPPRVIYPSDLTPPKAAEVGATDSDRVRSANQALSFIRGVQPQPGVA